MTTKLQSSNGTKYYIEDTKKIGDYQYALYRLYGKEWRHVRNFLDHNAIISYINFMVGIKVQ